jgi:hypothetical protein
VMSCFTASPNLRTPIRDGASAMALAPPAAPSSCDLSTHVTVSFPLIGISEFASLQCEELALLESPIPDLRCHLSSVHGKGPGAHAPVVIGKSRFGKSRFLMRCVTDLSKSRTPICDATCRRLRARLNPSTPVLHYTRRLRGLSRFRISEFLQQ